MGGWGESVRVGSGGEVRGMFENAGCEVRVGEGEERKGNVR